MTPNDGFGRPGRHPHRRDCCACCRRSRTGCQCVCPERSCWPGQLHARMYNSSKQVRFSCIDNQSMVLENNSTFTGTVATNPSILDHSMDSYQRFTLLPGLEIQKFKIGTLYSSLDIEKVPSEHKMPSCRTEHA
jgi:hypothetical protein